MFYPEDFKNRVKEVYPNWEELHRGLDIGESLVGERLYNSALQASNSISINTVLAATSLEELKKEAEAADVKMNLYREWRKLFESNEKTMRKPRSNG